LLPAWLLLILMQNFRTPLLAYTIKFFHNPCCVFWGFDESINIYSSHWPSLYTFVKCVCTPINIWKFYAHLFALAFKIFTKTFAF
jgi:hypothetical protein